jgi:hypothetical protein
MILKPGNKIFWVLMVLFSVLSAEAQYVTIAPEPMEGYEYLPYFPEKLMEQKPQPALANNSLGKYFIYSTDRLDTISIHRHFLIGNMDSTQMFCFVETDKMGADQFLAVRNDKNWVILKMRILRHLAYDAVEFKLVRLGKKKELHLQVMVYRDKNVESKYGSRVDSEWKRAKSISLFNLNTLHRVLSNVYLGYEYHYTQKVKINGLVYRETKQANVWYDFDINYKRGKIKVKLMENKRDLVKQSGELIPERIETQVGKNAPLLTNGIYKYDGQKFVWKK